MILYTFYFRAEKDRLHAEKMAKQLAKEATEQERNQPIPEVTYLSIHDQNTYPHMGDMTRVMSRSRTLRNFVKVSTLEDSHLYPKDSSVWIRGRVHSIRVKGGSAFLVLRQDSFHTVQACFFKDKSDPEGSAKMLQYLKSLTVESMVDLEGRVNTGADVKSCSVKSVELTIQRIYSVSNAAAILPFLVEDAARSDAEIDASQSTDRPFPVSYYTTHGL
jgi:aspartyl-tRNA synthetase